MNKEKISINNIIIGAGPSGLQLAYYFEKYDIEYIILERNSTCGSLYQNYSDNKKLLSINKKYNNHDNYDYNLRYDWNTLLNDENFSFKDYSDDYYPYSKDLHKYLNDFSIKFKLKIKYNENVKKILKNKFIYEIETESEIYICNKLIIATGLSKPIIPKCKKYIKNNENIKHISEFDKNYFLEIENLTKFKNKSVLLVGLGNSSLEISNILYNYCSNILITGNQRDLSIISHYDGDIRCKYMNFYDTFLLNIMNGIDNKILTDKEVIVENSNGKYYILSHCEDGILFCNSIKYFDYIIYCTGKEFDLSIFDNSIIIKMNGKYPQIKFNYESIDYQNLFFIGSLMHSLDYKKNSGGFIKGYRYLIKLFFKTNYMITIDKPINFNFNGTLQIYHDLAYLIYERINYSSSLFNLPDYITDIFYYDKESNNIKYYKDNIYGLRLNLYNYYNDTNHLCVLKLRYGEKINDFKKIGIYNKFNPTLLHPEILIYYKNENNIFIIKDKIIFEENLVHNFEDKENYYDKLVRSLKSCIVFE